MACSNAKPKPTPEEEARNLSVRATETQVRAWRAKVRLAMSNCPSSLSCLIQALAANGYTDERISKPEDVEKSRQMLAVQERQKRKRETSAEVTPEKDKEVGGPAATDPIPTKYWHIHDLSRNMVRDMVMPGLDGTNLTAANCRSTMDKLGVAASKKEYCKIWEFVTGKDTHFQLTGRYRWFSNVRGYGWNRAVGRGRRGLLLRLPPNWPKDGVYAVLCYREADDKVGMLQRFTKEEAWIPRADLPSFETIEQLFVDKNWSETEATVKSMHIKQQDLDADDALGHCVGNYFKHHLVEYDAQADTAAQFTQVKLRKAASSDNLLASGMAAPVTPTKMCKSESPHGSPATTSRKNDNDDPMVEFRKQMSMQIEDSSAEDSPVASQEAKLVADGSKQEVTGDVKQELDTAEQHKAEKVEQASYDDYYELPPSEECNE